MLDFPQEIHDEILHCRLLEHGDLKACSLVCRAWLPTTRSRLFKTVKILSAHDLRSFLAVIRHAATRQSSIAHYMQEIVLSNLKLNLDSLPRDAVAPSLIVHQLLSLLPSLRAVTLESIEWSQSTDPDLPVYFANVPITSLQLTRIRLRSPGDLLRLASSLPSLSALSLSFVRWEAFDLDNAYFAANDDLGRTIQLQSLRVHKCFNARGLLRGLLAAPFETRLARLDWTLCDMWGEASPDDLYQHEVDEAPLLSALLQASNTTLTELHLSTYWEDACKHRFAHACATTQSRVRAISPPGCYGGGGHAREDIRTQRLSARRLSPIRHLFRVLAPLPQSQCACPLMRAAARTPSRYL